MDTREMLRQRLKEIHCKLFGIAKTNDQIAQSLKRALKPMQDELERLEVMRGQLHKVREK